MSANIPPHWKNPVYLHVCLTNIVPGVAKVLRMFIKRPGNRFSEVARAETIYFENHEGHHYQGINDIACFVLDFTFKPRILYGNAVDPQSIRGLDFDKEKVYTKDELTRELGTKAWPFEISLQRIFSCQGMLWMGNGSSRIEYDTGQAIYFEAKSASRSGEYYNFHLSGSPLVRGPIHCFEEWMPTFQLKITGTDSKKTVLWESDPLTEEIKGQKLSEWNFRIPCNQICGGSPRVAMYVELYGNNTMKNCDELIATGHTKVIRALMQGEPGEFEMKLTHAKKRSQSYAGQLSLEVSRESGDGSLGAVDHIMGGMILAYSVASDFSGVDNGMRLDIAYAIGKRLEYLVQDYDIGSKGTTDQPQIPGAMVMDGQFKFLKPRGFREKEKEKSVLEGLPMPHPEDRLPEFMQKFEYSMKTVPKTQGPTAFTPFLTMLSGRQTRRNKFTIILILTNGNITDVDAIPAEIEPRSGGPNYYIVVGIGNGDFSGLQSVLNSCNCPNGGPAANFLKANDYIKNGKFDKLQFVNDALGPLEDVICRYQESTGNTPAPLNVNPPFDFTSKAVLMSWPKNADTDDFAPEETIIPRITSPGAHEAYKHKKKYEDNERKRAEKMGRMKKFLKKNQPCFQDTDGPGFSGGGYGPPRGGGYGPPGGGGYGPPGGGGYGPPGGGGYGPPGGGGYGPPGGGGYGPPRGGGGYGPPGREGRGGSGRRRGGGGGPPGWMGCY